MPANVLQMAYVGDVPWHGIGKKIDGKGMTIEQVLKESGLDFEVHKIPIFFKNRKPEKQGKIDTHFATIRTDTWDVLGVVGTRYEVMQNKEGFKPFETLVGVGKATYDVAGVLGSGEKVWILAKLPDSIRLGGEDIVEKFMLFAQGHDGRMKSILKLTPVRVVCANTLSLALSGGEIAVKILHTKNASVKLEQATKSMGLVNEAFSEAEEIFRRMVQVKMADKMTRAYFDRVFPSNPLSREHPVTERKRRTALELMEVGKGANFKTSKGTLWGAYNAITELVDHMMSPKALPSDRLESVWFGTGDFVKKRAFQEAVKLIRA
jgi:phage/plasmid-like protein (TIGR03299 family)